MTCTGTKIYITNLPPMFWSFDFLFSNNLNDVVSVACISSLNKYISDVLVCSITVHFYE